MSNCYKCGRELPAGQTECEPGECNPMGRAERVYPRPSDEEIERAGRQWASEHLEPDWSKVKTLEQVLLILRHSDVPIFIEKKSPAAKELKDVLRPIRY